MAPSTGKKSFAKSTAVKLRPQTANIQQQLVNNPTLMPASPATMMTRKATTHNQQKKKTDPVSRYQNMQNQWKSSSFLKASDSKQGRKLELDRFHKWSTVVHAQSQQTTQKKGQVHKYILQNNKAPTDDRRDDMRF
jgi:hypothetical protein